MTKTPPTSLRIPIALRVRVEKWATENKVARNAAYVQMIERGMKAAGPHPGLNERPLRGGLSKALEPKDALPIHKAPHLAKISDGVTESLVQIGPIRPKYGERAKKPKGAK